MVVAAALMAGATIVRADDQHVVSLTCRGMEVRKAISILQTVSDLRVVVDPKVPHKRLTLSLKDLSPEDALKTIVAAASLSYRKVGNAYLVETVAAGAGTTKPEPADGSRGGASGLSPTVDSESDGIVRPDLLTAPGATGLPAHSRAAVAIAPAVLAALEHTVDVDVKNGPLTEVMAQLSHSTGIQITADGNLSNGLLATVGLHGIPLKSALEMVAGQTGLQISPRPDGVAFVASGLSLDAAQARQRHAPAGAKHVDQGQLWTAEWADVLSSGFSAFDSPVVTHSLRRQSFHPGAHSLEFKPRSGGPRLIAPPATRSGGGLKGKALSTVTPPARPCHGRALPAKGGLRCAHCGRLLAPGRSCCPACKSAPAQGHVASAGCPLCLRPRTAHR